MVLCKNRLAHPLSGLKPTGDGWHMQELDLLTVRVSGKAGASLSVIEPAQKELAAAQRRLEESFAEVQRLTAYAAACREEVCFAVHSTSVSS